MQAALNFPQISPELISFTIAGFELAIRWYALAYIAGLLIGWRMVVWLVRRESLWPQATPPMKPQEVEELLTWIIVGVILGGRLGYVLFYEPAVFLAEPGRVIRVWEGGMAFHGGLLGVIVAAIIFCRLRSLPLASVADALAIATPTGLFLGRIANFINAELWGRPTDVAWGVVFPGNAAQACDGPAGLIIEAGQVLCARHPSQLYEAMLEGLVLGLVLLWLSMRRDWLKRPGMVTGLFFAGYGAARFFVEFYRQADAQFRTADNPMGYVIDLGAAGLTMGQILSLPMLLGGLVILGLSARQPRPA
ncbi:MAG: prolipoprotein diacylglyceryl transferase [Pseudomonadota bacterium]